MSGNINVVFSRRIDFCVVPSIRQINNSRKIEALFMFGVA